MNSLASELAAMCVGMGLKAIGDPEGWLAVWFPPGKFDLTRDVHAAVELTGGLVLTFDKASNDYPGWWFRHYKPVEPRTFPARKRLSPRPASARFRNT